MQTQHKPADSSTTSHDRTDALDRTDILPVLDVEAYEQTLVESQKSLSRTDTWTVEALRDIDELVESATHEAGVEVRSINLNREGQQAEALTVNVDRILKRIADLEADIVMAHDANAVLQKRNEALQIERDQNAARLEALVTEHARLGEHRTLAEEMAQRTEKQLRADAQRLDAQIKQMNDGHAKSLALAERALGNEKSNAGELARRLAAKLTEYDKLVLSIEQRNRTIDEIVAVRDDLDQRLRRELAASAEIRGKLVAGEDAMQANRALLLEREGALAEAERQRVGLVAQIAELRTSLQAAERSLQDAHREVTVAAKARGDEERRRVEVEERMRVALAEAEAKLQTTTANLEEKRRVATAELEARLQTATSEFETKLQTTTADLVEQRRIATAELEARLHTTTAELETQLRTTTTDFETKLQTTTAALEEQRRAATAELEGRLQATTSELGAKLQDITTRHEVLVAEHDSAQAQIRALSTERDALLPASTELAARTAELERTVATLAKLRNDLNSAETDAQAGERLAQEQARELASMREKVDDYSAAIRRVENDVQAQEQVVEGLRVQLQTAHEECAIMADQREKARARSKQLTQEIFRRDHTIEELQADLAVHSEALAAIRRDVNRIGGKGDRVLPAMAEDSEWMLDPLDHSGEAVRLTGSMLTVGRTAENDIALPSKMISRHHARLLIGPNGIIVEDAGSTNGCFVNGEQVKQHLMHDNDVLELGDLRYRLRLRASRETSVRANVVSLFDQNAD
jgi:DNA repair exonuclease SbcCD ATPase subunit